MARTRKTSDKDKTSGSEDEIKNEIEDAVVVEETDTIKEELPSSPESSDPEWVEETAPEAATEIAAAETGADVGQDEKPDVDPAVPEEAGTVSETEPTETASPDPAAADAEPLGQAEATPPSTEPPPPARQGRGGGSVFVAVLFGGLIAALAGVVAARYVFPDGWPGQSDTGATLAELQSAAETGGARIAELESALSGLSDEIAAIPDPAAMVDDLREELSGQISGQIGTVQSSVSDTATRLGDFEDRLADLEARLDELAMRPIPEGLDTSSLDTELSEFRAELSAAVEAARGEIVSAQEEAAAIAARAADEAAAQEQAAAEEADALRARAEEAAAAAARDSAVSRIRAAIENGEPYADELAALGDAEVPSALSDPATEGVPSLASLVEIFPSAARDALDASVRATMGDGLMDRATAFLRVQTGARSLEPRSGDDPDAVLSRAEAALRSGNLDAALTELSALPDAGQQAMAGWIGSARTRLAAVEAVQSLTPN